MPPVLLWRQHLKTVAILSLIGFVMLFNTLSGEAAPSLGDPFDGNALKNPNWNWKASDEEGVEPKKWDMSKTKAGWLHVTGELNNPAPQLSNPSSRFSPDVERQLIALVFAERDAEVLVHGYIPPFCVKHRFEVEFSLLDLPLL